MTDWLRVIGWSIVSLLIALGLLATGWIVWSTRKLNQFRFTDDKHLTESRVGWWGDQKKSEPQERER